MSYIEKTCQLKLFSMNIIFLNTAAVAFYETRCFLLVGFYGGLKKDRLLVFIVDGTPVRELNLRIRRECVPAS